MRFAKIRSSAVRRWDAVIPHEAAGSTIPRIVHQSYPHADLPPALAKGIAADRNANPEWDFRLYTDDGIEAFIRKEYGPLVLSAYLSIAPEYGAARVDLFRYLAIYKLGGVYLDIKSRFTRPIDEVLDTGAHFVVAQWSNRAGEVNEGIGLHPDISDVPGGEYQQWHVIAAPGHPFLRAVIIDVLAGIECYTPWRTSVGRIGVLRLTGPIAYTRAIYPILDRYPHLFLRDNDAIALQYSAYERDVIFKSRHYSELTAPIIRSGRLISRLSGEVFRFARHLRNKRRQSNSL